ncbi:superfamily I DNA/RNA helicase [Spinactinospora alkalitolerans]|uniref:DNA 3'-5' helicase n=1 Tax=Spinactinospora alkalitolerans TaxID=687207 RepID=A0A852TW83_9ACTN|nr:DEAD/DEAH box helicase [Spinactinospora alkalitolerans]NYE47567.1 superfamily I DNA/RNA helicase [Spinactinospora alkalitolerans]
MPQLAFEKRFFKGGDYDALPVHVRKNVREAMDKFPKLTPAQLKADKGLNFKPPAGARNRHIRTFKVDNFHRGVVFAPEGGGTLLLLKVLPHDDAYAWAAKLDAGVNSATRGLEVWDAEGLERVTPAMERRAAGAGRLLFADISDGDLRALGVDDTTLRAARTIVDAQQLEVFAPYLPEDQAEVLQFLANGFGVEEVWRDIVAHRAPAPAAGDDSSVIETAIRNTPTRIALVSGAEELAEILDRPFAEWRIFLHPSQRKVAYRPSYPGSYQVTGGPGTGKSVVAMHRVRHLLNHLRPGERILLTTFTNALVSALRSGLTELVADPDLLERVDVTTVNAQAGRVLTEAAGGEAPHFLGDAEEQARWKEIAERLDLPWNERFLAQEYRHVVLAQRIDDPDAYLAADRPGRGRPLARALRPLLWRAMSEFTAGLDADGVHTHLRACDVAARTLEEEGPLYRHVVVDEAQDLHPAQWRLLRAAVPVRPDDLFIAGDPHQRIYDAKVSLKSLGIKVVGRTTRLKRNYRSTQEILAWSRALLDGRPVEGLADGGDDTLAGYRSSLHGAAPVAFGAPDQDAEVAEVVRRVRAWVEAGIAPSEIAVAARFNAVARKVKEGLVAEGVPAVLLRSTPKPETEGVRAGTMHALKGLEFRCVAVAGVCDWAVPFAKAVTPADVDPIQHATDLMAERCLLFVACTRARDQLHVSWHKEPSEFLTEAGIA